MLTLTGWGSTPSRTRTRFVTKIPLMIAMHSNIHISIHANSAISIPQSFSKQPLRKCYGNNNSPSSKISVNIQKHHIFTSEVLPCSTQALQRLAWGLVVFNICRSFCLGDCNSSIFTFENPKNNSIQALGSTFTKE